LHPKVDGAVEVKDFRPISLFHNFGKHVTKLLATRLAPRMSELVHANQSAWPLHPRQLRSSAAGCEGAPPAEGASPPP
jgi:hypothetical protein